MPPCCLKHERGLKVFVLRRGRISGRLEKQGNTTCIAGAAVPVALSIALLRVTMLRCSKLVWQVFVRFVKITHTIIYYTSCIFNLKFWWLNSLIVFCFQSQSRRMHVYLVFSRIKWEKVSENFKFINNYMVCLLTSGGGTWRGRGHFTPINFEFYLFQAYLISNWIIWTNTMHMHLK